MTNSKAGTVKSHWRATLSPDVGGRVAELPARKAARAKQGDLLMRIADADYRAQVLLQESAFPHPHRPALRQLPDVRLDFPKSRSHAAPRETSAARTTRRRQLKADHGTDRSR